MEVEDQIMASNSTTYASRMGTKAKNAAALQNATSMFFNNYNQAQEMQLKREALDIQRAKALAKAQEPFGGNFMQQMLALNSTSKLDPSVQSNVLSSYGFKVASDPVVKSPNNSAAVPPTELAITGATKSGPTIGQSPESKVAQSIYETGEKVKSSAVGESAGGQLKSEITSDYNLDLVSGALLPLAQTMANAYIEGGAGNIIKKGITNLAQSGWLPESMQEELSDSTAVTGKKTEVLLKMMPLMSSQYGKEGSTRIIKGIFDKLGETLPDLENAPLNAIKMIENSVDTLYGVVRAVNNVNLKNYDIDDETQRENLINRIVILSQNLEIMGEEKAALDNLKATITGPIQAYRVAKKRGLI